MSKGDSQHDSETSVEVVADATHDGAFEIHVRSKPAAGRVSPTGDEGPRGAAEREDADDSVRPDAPRSTRTTAVLIGGAALLLAGAGVVVASQRDDVAPVSVDDLEIERPAGFEVFQVQSIAQPVLPQAPPDAGVVLTVDPAELWRHSGVVIPEPAPPGDPEPLIDPVMEERLRAVPVEPVRPVRTETIIPLGVQEDTQRMFGDVQRLRGTPPPEAIDPIGIDEDDYDEYDEDSYD